MYRHTEKVYSRGQILSRLKPDFIHAFDHILRKSYLYQPIQLLS